MTFEEQTPYEQIGGDPEVRRLVDRFYDHMDALPEVKVIRAMHPASLDESRDHLYWFLLGWMGGPSIYIERRGAPRMRARHLPFAIDDSAAAQWMHCMDLALAEVVTDDELRRHLHNGFARVANHMRNQPS